MKRGVTFQKSATPWAARKLTSDKRSRSELHRLAGELSRRERRATSRELALLHPLLHEDTIDELTSNATTEDDFAAWKGSTTFRYEDVVQKARSAVQAKPWYFIDPEGFFRRMWDCVAAVFIYMLIIYIPMTIAYFDEPSSCNYFHIYARSNGGAPTVHDLPFEWGWQFPIVATNYFFVVDIFLNFLTGAEREDAELRTKVTDYSPRAVWMTYIRTWLIFDIVACFPLECILVAGAPNVIFYNFGNAIRLVRVFGLRRRAHGSPWRWIDQISDVRSEFSYAARRLTVVAFSTFLAVNYFACSIWFIIRLQNFPPVTWPGEKQLDLLRPGVTMLEQYLWSIFCAISAMIGNSYGSFPPMTWPEAIIWTFGMTTVAAMFAVTNGTIISIIISNASGRERCKRLMDQINELTSTRGLPDALRTRILDHFKYKYRSGIMIKDSNIMAEMPDDMQAQIAMHSTGALLRKVPFLMGEPDLLERVSLLLTPTVALGGETVIRQGWPSRSMYFIKHGYVDLMVDGKVVDTMRDGDYFGEVALLPLPSGHELLKVGVGLEEITKVADLFTSALTARALTPCDMFELSADAFHEVILEYPTTLARLSQLAIRHARRLRKTGANLNPRFSTAHAVVFRDDPEDPPQRQSVPRESEDTVVHVGEAKGPGQKWFGREKRGSKGARKSGGRDSDESGGPSADPGSGQEVPETSGQAHAGLRIERAGTGFGVG